MSSLLLDRYEVLEEIGSGGFASVVVAWDTRIQRKVAIKCLPLGDDIPAAQSHSVGSILLEENADEALEIPGLEEARTAAMLNDAHIVSVFDFELQYDTAYLILEYIEGMTLGDLLRDYPDEVDSDVIAAVFYGVSHALEVAHKHKVLHLDIKPDNVLIDTQGQVKVVDFGLARLYGEQGFGAATGGTIGYMPLEQMHQEDLDERCDEWALASLTYEMIVGANPFSARDLDQAEKRIVDAELVVPSVCLDGTDPSIDDILFCALDPSREERYDSVADFAHEMQQCLGDRRKGTRKLARIVGQVWDDEEEDTSEGEDARTFASPRTVSKRTKSLLLRGWAVVGAALIGFVCLQNASFLAGGWQDPVTWGIFAAFLLVTALIPSLGLVVTLCGVGVSLMWQDAPLAGVFLIVAAIAWWLVVGRMSVLHANVGVATVVFGSIGLAPLGVLLAGYALRVRDAVLTSLFAVCFSAVFAGLGSESLLGWNAMQFSSIRMWTHVSDNLAAMLQGADFWLMALAWLVACALMAVCCMRASRVLAALGAVLASAVMAAALVGAALIAGLSTTEVNPLAVASIAGAGAITLILCGFGVPSRVEQSYPAEAQSLPLDQQS